MMATHKVETEKHADVMIASKVCKKKKKHFCAPLILSHDSSVRKYIFFTLFNMPLLCKTYNSSAKGILISNKIA